MEELELNYIQKKVGYTFKNKDLLINALTHSSYANEHGCANNERLEFLGDSVLSIIISSCIFENLTEIDEGMLSKIRASLVCEHSLSEIAKKIDLGELIRLGRGEEKTGGRMRASVVSDAFEAMLGAIYKDSDLETATSWLMPLMEKEINDAEKKRVFGDFKTQLQELVQRRKGGNVTYKILKESGSDHYKAFEVEVVVNGVFVAEGKGSSKKEAEQAAASIAVSKILNDGNLSIINKKKEPDSENKNEKL